MKFKYLLALTILFCSFNANSQSKGKEGEIIISEENLIHLIQKIRAKRDANYLLSQKTNVVTNTKSDVDLSKVNSKLVTLEKELKYLTNLLESKNTTEEINTEYFILKKDSNEVPITEKVVYIRDTIYSLKETIYNTTDTVYKTELVDATPKTKDTVYLSNKTYKPVKSVNLKETNEKPTVVENKKPTSTKNIIVPSAAITANNNTNDSTVKAIERLESKIDSLFAANKTNKEVIYLSNNQTTKNNSDKATTKTDTVYVNNTNSKYELLKSKFSGFKEKVYFENNSSEINNSKKIDSIITLLNSNENLDVYLKGFASNKGNAIYNQELSFKRAETIKRYLVSNGIHPSRILSQFHGIDYESKNETEARRVELSFIIRK
ncbi:OmpA family protein [uncultured Flavobacterium sp.]|uniref:OmpA family protein n=1 Tax=uncultured Flavobacterium sp. TaxID=165435 RepID=UPI0030EED12B|tara:strand:+ start:103430 stop:104563 length:1134 start_codon:yes stop_codon:yes gene_type:complete